MSNQQVVPVLAYRVNEVCKMLGLSVSKIYDLVAKNELKALNLGGRTVITAAELQRFLDAAQPITLNRASSKAA